MLKRLITWSLPVVFVALAWQIMDTSPTLFLYNLVMPAPRFTGQTIWITGASSGIGAALVCEFARSGARHVVLSARRVEKMQQVIENCKKQLLLQKQHDDVTTTFSVVPYDALQVNATTTTVRQAIDSTPAASIDILVLNSGIYQLKPALETTAAERQKLSRVNLEAPIALSQALIQMDHWKEREHGGTLVVVSSIMAKGPHGLCSFYAATKAALRNYFQTLSAEEFDWLTVKMILPGGTATDMWKNGFGDTVQTNPNAMMTPERVAQLTTTAVAGPWRLFWEVWISPPAGLLYAFMSHYMPALFYFTNHFIAWLRLAAFRRDAVDVIEIKALIPILVDKMLGKL